MSRLRLTALLAGSLLLASCVTSDKPVDLGNGVRGYHIVCSGTWFSNNGDCESRASHICGGDGYTVLKESDPPYAHDQKMLQNSTHDITVTCNTPQSQQAPQIQTFP